MLFVFRYCCTRGRRPGSYPLPSWPGALPPSSVTALRWGRAVLDWPAAHRGGSLTGHGCACGRRHAREDPGDVRVLVVDHHAQDRGRDALR